MRTSAVVDVIPGVVQVWRPGVAGISDTIGFQLPPPSTEYSSETVVTCADAHSTVRSVPPDFVLLPRGFLRIIRAESGSITHGAVSTSCRITAATRGRNVIS